MNRDKNKAVTLGSNEMTSVQSPFFHGTDFARFRHWSPNLTLQTFEVGAPHAVIVASVSNLR